MSWIDRKEELNELIHVKKLSNKEISQIYGCVERNVADAAYRLGIIIDLKNIKMKNNLVE